MNPIIMDEFWQIYFICIFLYLVIIFISYKIETVVYGGIDDDQIAAGLQLFIISLIPVINWLVVIFGTIGLIIKLFIVIEDIFNGDSKIN